MSKLSLAVEKQAANAGPEMPTGRTVRLTIEEEAELDALVF